MVNGILRLCLCVYVCLWPCTMITVQCSAAVLASSCYYVFSYGCHSDYRQWPFCWPWSLHQNEERRWSKKLWRRMSILLENLREYYICNNVWNFINVYLSSATDAYFYENTIYINMLILFLSFVCILMRVQMHFLNFI